MAARLGQITRTTHPMNNPFLNDQRAAFLQGQLVLTTNALEELHLRGVLGRELLNGGEPREALVEFNRALELARHAPNLSSRARGDLDLYIAMCHLRRGEIDNCVAFHGPDSCLLPISPSAVHKNQEGSRAAIGALFDIMSQRTDNLTARWLLNVAYMTLGEYPQNVPPQWLIPPQAFASDCDFPRFANIAAAVGLAQDGLAGGTVTDDFDNDGDIDVMVSEWGLHDQLRLYANNGDGTFTERTEQAGLTGLVGGLNMLQADYNNDGFVDVLVLRGAWMGSSGRYPNSLLHNHGDGTFEDMTEKAGLLSFHPTQTATWFDFNNDGAIDLFIGNESSRSEDHPCELYRNNGNGTFTECAAAVGISIAGFVKGVTSGDYDNDGRPDLYLSIRGETNVLFHNEGPAPSATGQQAGTWRFKNVTQRAGVGEPIFSFPTWFFDYDNDGWQDLFVSGYNIRGVGDIAADYLGLPHSAERARLFRNDRNGTFTDVTKPAGLYKVLHTMGSNFGDLDNDGYLDFYLGTGDPDLATIIPNRMFRNDAGQKFQDITSAGGFGHLQKGHGISFADLDNDGDQDVYQSLGGAYSGDSFRNVLFENPGTSNRWIGLKLEGVQSNRSAIGARIQLTVDNGKRRVFKTVNSGGSFGANPLAQHIGLGTATNATVEIFWPASRKTQIFANLSAGSWYHIREDSAKATPLKLPHFKLGGQTVTMTRPKAAK